MLIHEDRLLPADPDTRAIARRLYDEVRDLPIIAPHGHTEPRWYAEDEPFPDPSQLMIVGPSIAHASSRPRPPANSPPPARVRPPSSNPRRFPP